MEQNINFAQATVDNNALDCIVTIKSKESEDAAIKRILVVGGLTMLLINSAFVERLLGDVNIADVETVSEAQTIDNIDAVIVVSGGPVRLISNHTTKPMQLYYEI